MNEHCLNWRDFKTPNLILVTALFTTSTYYLVNLVFQKKIIEYRLRVGGIFVKIEG